MRANPPHPIKMKIGLNGCGSCLGSSDESKMSLLLFLTGGISTKYLNLFFTQYSYDGTDSYKGKDDTSGARHRDEDDHSYKNIYRIKKLTQFTVKKSLKG